LNDPLAPGSLLRDRYRVQRSISVGGWGEVYRGIDLIAGSTVAIKRCLKRPRGGSSDFSRDYVMRRAQEEISVLKELDCAGIPSFVDSFSLEGEIDCLVMEFIDGTDLNQQVRDSTKLAGRLPAVSTVVDYVIQVCRILEYLHSLSPPMIHRDIKPSNLILCHADSKVYLVDFGFARHIGPSAGTKSMVGTLGYAAIEQCQGHPTVLSDQYALGATLFFLLTGSQPTPFAIESLASFRSDLPQALVDSVAKATQPNAVDRYASIGEWSQDLKRVWAELLTAEVQLGSDSTLVGLPLSGLTRPPDSFEFQPDTTEIEPDSSQFSCGDDLAVSEPQGLTAEAGSSLNLPDSRGDEANGAKQPAKNTPVMNHWLALVSLLALTLVLVGGFHRFGPRASLGTPLNQPSVDGLTSAWPAPLSPKLLNARGSVYRDANGKIVMGAVASGGSSNGFALRLQCVQPTVLKIRWEGGGAEPVFFLRCHTKQNKEAAGLCLKLVGINDELGKFKSEWSIYGLPEPAHPIAKLETPSSSAAAMLPPDLASWARWRNSVLEFQLNGETELSLSVDSASKPLQFSLEVF
jgi:serine/threonine protein kinase